MGISLRELRAKLGLLAVGLQGFQLIQDPVDYDTLTHRSDMDTWDHALRSGAGGCDRFL